MNQIVYVVVDIENENLIGVYNEYEDALHSLEGYNSPDVSITPVLVDAAPDYERPLTYSENDMEGAVDTELELAYAAKVAEMEDYEYEYEDEEDEDDEELTDEELNAARDFIEAVELIIDHYLDTHYNE